MQLLHVPFVFQEQLRHSVYKNQAACLQIKRIELLNVLTAFLLFWIFMTHGTVNKCPFSIFDLE